MIAALAAFVLPTAGSGAAKAPAVGRALLTYVASNGGVCLVRADGTHAVRLTPRWKRVDGLAWSPRGKYLAMQRFVGYDHNHDQVTKISVADARGRLRWTFGDGGSGNSRPLWSSDGRAIAYFESWAHAGGLAVARPNGSNDQGISGCIGNPLAFCPSRPTWSADGRCLAFVDRADLDTPPGIFRVCFDGSGSRELVVNASWPAFAPKGSMLAYTGPNGTDLGSLFVADGDGGNPRAVTEASRDVIEFPAWSPDAKRLAFVRIPCQETCALNGKIVVARADGTGEELEVATVPPTIAGFAWSPGGKQIAFLRGRSVFITNTDGSGERKVVARVRVWGGPAILPAWRPAVPLPVEKRPSCPRR